MVELALVGALAGVTAGMLGVGGGAIIVPGLVIFVGAGQVQAEATSLLAIVPVALVGAWRQRRYGNLRLDEGVRLGLLAAAGAAAGAVIANAVPPRALEVGFAAVLVVVAWRLGRRALAREQPARVG